MRSDDHHASSPRREGRHGPDGHRRPRFFGNGELRLVMLDILCGGASHGYELIKAIETLTAGHYAPSPGVVYPTLDALEAQGFIAQHEEDTGRKKIAITDAGRAWLEENRETLTHIHARMRARAIGHQLRKDPQMKRALDNMKAVLDLKVNQAQISPETLKQIIGIIDQAALDISQLD
ncbi:Transcriptional regulator, PadR family [Cronobacter condimenti 1330]|uniref:PadR family transcriptional regulator n=1 Tax=Cronobacter condimenti 1330 TaxID=1073999 RepID=K8A0A8_9ENTR|nr:PadR family transcriptional regulator [Cronobacter condimenti]ALB61456.1 PadR family transcriptional regulator [Cronobacter condimenti 1330]CCJ72683.1 Transcriptional regulator, PadR family [Cronobacter condimenti 1330]